MSEKSKCSSGLKGCFIVADKGFQCRLSVGCCALCTVVGLLTERPNAQPDRLCAIEPSGQFAKSTIQRTTANGQLRLSPSASFEPSTAILITTAHTAR